MTSEQPIVEPYKVRGFVAGLTKEFQRREPLAANFTAIRCIEDHRRFQLQILISIRSHRGIIPHPLSLNAYEDSTPYEEFSVQGNMFMFPLDILAFEQYHRENGFVSAIIDAIIFQLDSMDALGPMERNRA